jgi:hypothetical protein
MNKDKIKEIGIDELERLYVTPQVETFPFMYREAMEVHWDEKHKCLYAPKPREWSRLDWFKQIISAAKEQGCKLQITDETAWVNIPSELKSEITTWSKEKNA